ncbi:hypothetical protein QRD89_16855 [Halobacillus sp. ACCC02827]|uniref:hypothetical protein n=1 Tax=Halobacillus sp. ACCC02827 TaxID=3052090 RepID=UPI0025702AD7|nr:hypothetical protein [Halobacillus sp. ACCC02827]WJE15372.1 hypothetical protein QRD89_16855 [Halobacillus sp. ACCC02827]
MDKRMACTGYSLFLAGIALFLLSPPKAQPVFVPIFTIGGLCLLIIALFLSMKKSR